jgi:biotin carboxyl carrier protein
MTEQDNLKFLNIGSSLYKTRLSPKFISRKPYQKADHKSIVSFIPGTVIDVLVTVGQRVKTGDDLMVLDAMKMQNKLKCKTGGTIKKIMVKKGDKVSKGTLLLRLGS